MQIYICLYRLQDLNYCYSWVSYERNHIMSIICMAMGQFVIHGLKFKVFNYIFNIDGRRKWIQNNKKWKVRIVRIKSYLILSIVDKSLKKTEAGLNLPKNWTYDILEICHKYLIKNHLGKNLRKSKTGIHVLVRNYIDNTEYINFMFVRFLYSGFR